MQQIAMKSGEVSRLLTRMYFLFRLMNISKVTGFNGVLEKLSRHCLRWGVVNDEPDCHNLIWDPKPLISTTVEFLTFLSLLPVKLTKLNSYISTINSLGYQAIETGGTMISRDHEKRLSRLKSNLVKHFPMSIRGIQCLQD